MLGHGVLAYHDNVFMFLAMKFIKRTHEIKMKVRHCGYVKLLVIDLLLVTTISKGSSATLANGC